jgi:hypothetical protein
MTQFGKPSETVWRIERRKRPEDGRKQLLLFLETERRFRRGGVAHRLEQAAHNHLVVGSIPTTPTKI